MICRNRRISSQSAEVQLRVSFTHADIRSSLKRYFDLCATPCGAAFASSIAHAEPDLCHFLANDIFALFTGETFNQLCRWFVYQAEKLGLIYRGHDDAIYLNPDLGRKRGRPPETIS